MRQLLDEGVVLFDEPCEQTTDCISLLLDKFEDNGVFDNNNRLLVQNLFVKEATPMTTPVVDHTKEVVESCKVFITAVPNISKPVAGLIRASYPIFSNTELPIRYVLVIIGKSDSTQEYCFSLLFLWLVITISVVPSL